MASLQIRNMPDEAHRKLKARAAMAGMSLSEYALAQLLESLEHPTIEELSERIAQLPPLDLGDTIVEIIREERDSR